MTTYNLIGTTIDKYTIMEEIGRGGMGIVYKAHQTDLDRIVAVKILLPELCHDESSTRRFLQEARSVARLEHPHIVPIYDTGVCEQTNNHSTLHYIVMKHIEGHTLKDVLQRHGRMDVAQCLALLTQAGHALDYAHRQGFLHRDVKPSNLMITHDGWCYLTDFGLAREQYATRGKTQTGAILGTPEYMSPEQAQGVATLTPASDVYAFGIILYEMLTGQLPFEADTPMGMYAARLLHAPRPVRQVCPDISPAVEAVVMRCIAREPQQRYADAADVCEALKRAQQHTPQHTLLLSSTHQPGSTGSTFVLPQTQSPAAEEITPAPVPTTSPSHRAYAPESYNTNEKKRIWSSIALLATPVGLITAVVLLFLLIGGWFRVMSVWTPAPTPIHPIPTMTIIPTVIMQPSMVSLSPIEEGWAAITAGDYDNAENIFRAILYENPSNYEATTGLAWALRHLEKYDESVRYFEESLAMKAQQPNALNGLAWNKCDLSDYAAAEGYFRQAIAFDVGYDNAYVGLGRALNAQERYQEAEQAYQQALAINPHNTDAQQALERLTYR